MVLGGGDLELPGTTCWGSRLVVRARCQLFWAANNANVTDRDRKPTSRRCLGQRGEYGAHSPVVFGSVTTPKPPSTPAAANPHASYAERPFWGLGDVWFGLVCSQVIASMVAVAVLTIGDWDTTDDAPLWTTALFSLGLHGTLAAVAVGAARLKGFGAVTDFKVRTVANDAGVGILSGVLAQLILVPLVTFPLIWLTSADIDDISESATKLTDRANTPVGVTVLIVTVAIVAPLVEELFFRGLLLGAYRKRRNLPWLEAVIPQRLGGSTLAPKWNTFVGVAFSSLIFGLIHFQPLLIPALTAAGVVFAVLAVRYDRLGPAIWAHVAFNTTTLINLLA